MRKETPPKRNPDVSWRTIEGQAVLIHNRLGEIQVLNDLGTYIWEHLELGPEVLARNIAQEHEVSVPDAQRDVEEFMKALRGSGALADGTD